MTVEIETANRRARRAAERAGRPTYAHQVIDMWAGCAVCAKPIKHNVNIALPGLWRSCDCPGVLWRCSTAPGGWERVDMEESE